MPDDESIELELRRRLNDLDAEIHEAKEAGDFARLAQLNSERDAVVAEIRELLPEGDLGTQANPDRFFKRRSVENEHIPKNPF